MRFVPFLYLYRGIFSFQLGGIFSISFNLVGFTLDPTNPPRAVVFNTPDGAQFWLRPGDPRSKGKDALALSMESGLREDNWRVRSAA